ncbi:MAG: hypothetical protein HW404_1695 [Anaerolineales bacterium]|nr:hypothetical protein [Anaerolineales bacterium]MBM2843858.1 hypothetical protein [Anaerolineales bacterium]
MREAGLDSRPQTARPRPLASAPGLPRIADSEGVSDTPALMLPPRLGVLRRPVNAEPLTIRRLVVPVPMSDLDEAGLGRRIWEIATPADLAVLFLARVDGPDAELRIRRRLTTLAALLRRRHGSVETLIAHDRSWIAAIRRVRAPGDAVVCCGGERTPKNPRPPSLADRVVTELRVPAYVLEDLSLNMADRPRLRLAGALSWVAPLLIVAAFGVMQSQVVIQAHGWVQTMLLLMTVGLELAALWFVESMVGSWR